MKVNSYNYPQSSFLAIEKDMDLLVNLIMKNERLKKLLYYDVPNALDMPRVPDEEAVKLFGNQIKIVPKMKVDKPEFCYMFINFDNFVPNGSNPAFRDNQISFEILCHFNQWQLTNFKLRPYAIAAEIDSMVNNKKLTGIGKMQFMGATQILQSDEFSGIALIYEAIHGYEGEDSKYPLNPNEASDLIESFNKIFN